MMNITTFGSPAADILLLQMVDDHDMEGIGRECSFIQEMTGGRDFCLKAVKVDSWFKDLSPWPAPAVLGNEAFGDGAASTLEYLQEKVLQEYSAEDDASREEPGKKKIFLGGYSLAGLFALWAGYQTDRFGGIAAASPSVWFPGFTDYKTLWARKPTVSTVRMIAHSFTL